MNTEALVRGFAYALAAAAVLAAAFWYGWEQRTRLALKLEHFRISNRRWVEYDEELKANKGRPPVLAEIHGIREQSER